jgi:glucosamine--fructose-6-phosphate aminotransferase (isomerizing)
VSTLATEAAEAPAAVRRAIAVNRDAFAALGARLRSQPPTFVATCARGSSDHAATYGAYVLSAFLGRPVASIGPSMVSIYGRQPQGMRGALVLAVSQSGQSPDVIQLVTAARAAGAFVVGLVNDVTSPLALACEQVIGLGAHPEHAVAATKSFLASAVALLQLAAEWSGDAGLADAVARAPDALDAAAALDWGPALAPLVTVSSMYIVGRGLGLGPAHELALKLKETCRLHAEAFSTAEILHGPIALVGPRFPVIALGQDDASAPGLREAIGKLVALGADVLSTIDAPGAVRAPAVRVPPVLEPLCAVQSFYLALPALAAARGFDADAPPHLRKVTETR